MSDLKSETLAIIMPVYNRSVEIKKLYSSLNKQVNKKFEWIVVDDGSSDNLDDLLTSWGENSKYKIILLRQKNQGKMVAYRSAVNYLYKHNIKWSIVVDSDDWLLPEATSEMLETIRQLENANYIGAVYPKVSKLTNMGDWTQKMQPSVNIIDLKYRYHINESAILIQTLQLKWGFDHIIFSNEKFMSEEILYNCLMTQGKFKVCKEKFYFAEYKKGGITNSIFKTWLRNPKNTIALLLSRYNALGSLPYKFRVIGRIKTIINLNAFCIKLNLNIRNVTPNKMLSIMCYLPALFLMKRRFK